MLEDEEEPHLNTDQVGCERNGSRVESPSANMPIVTGRKLPTPSSERKFLILEMETILPDGGEGRQRNRGKSPDLRETGRGDRETEPPFQGLPIPSCLLRCTPQRWISPSCRPCLPFKKRGLGSKQKIQRSGLSAICRARDGSRPAGFGAQFQANHIPIARVLSSEWCRCLETARLAFGDRVEPLPALNSFFSTQDAEAAQTRAVRAPVEGWRAQSGVLAPGHPPGEHHGADRRLPGRGRSPGAQAKSHIGF